MLHIVFCKYMLDSTKKFCNPDSSFSASNNGHRLELGSAGYNCTEKSDCNRPKSKPENGVYIVIDNRFEGINSIEPSSHLFESLGKELLCHQLFCIVTETSGYVVSSIEYMLSIETIILKIKSYSDTPQ